MNKKFKIIGILSILFVSMSIKYIYTQYEKRYTKQEKKIEQLYSLMNYNSEFLLLLEKVDIYQPLYGLNLPTKYNKKISRFSNDRADIIYADLKNIMDNKKIRILDVGSSLGYMSFYFADKGAVVEGIDNEENNIKLSKYVSKQNNIDVKFNLDDFNKEFVNKMGYDKDITFLFSVLHHINNIHGLEYTQELIESLLEKSPIIYAELALKEENVSYPWKKNLPEDELSFFAKCTSCEIVKLGNFSTHLSKTTRPLYKITKKNIKVNDKVYPFSKVFMDGFTHDEKKNDDRKTRFYEAGDYFIKEINDENNLEEKFKLYNDILKELSINNIEKIRDIEYKDNRLLLVFDKIKGKNLIDIKSDLTKEQKLEIFSSLINILSELEKKNIMHGDIRVWNVLYDEKDITLIDFEQAVLNLEKISNEINDILWFIYELDNSIKTLDHKYRSNNIPSDNLNDYNPYLQKLVKELLEKKINSMVEIKNFLEKNNK